MAKYDNVTIDFNFESILIHHNNANLYWCLFNNCQNLPLIDYFIK